MSNIDYKKVLEKLIRFYPHEIEKIKQVVNDANKNKVHSKLKIDFDDIIYNIEWNADEKAELIRFFGYSKGHQLIEHYVGGGGNYRKENISALKYVIEYDKFSSYVALVKTCRDISVYEFKDIFDEVQNIRDEKKREKHVLALLENMTEEEKTILIRPNYVGDRLSNIKDNSIFINIVKTKDIDLIEKHLKYVEDINIYFSEAVATGDIEIVKLFLERGADINYIDDEIILRKLSALQTAIYINNYEMFKFLINNGADINKTFKVSDALEKVKSFSHGKGNILGLEDLNEDNSAFKNLMVIRDNDLMLYATKLKEKNFKNNRYANLFDIYFKGGSSLEIHINCSEHEVSEKLKNRNDIINLIYEKTEDKSNIDYTDLLLMSFLAQDKKRITLYIKDILDNKRDIDFERLFDLYVSLLIDVDMSLNQILIDFINNYENKTELLLKLFNKNQNNRNNWGYPKYIMNGFDKLILGNMEEKVRIAIPLVPMCRSLDTLKELLALNFDLNMVDNFGNNILMNLFVNSNGEVTKGEIELFNYLIDNVDLSIKNNKKHDVLYYAMQAFPTKDENDWIKSKPKTYYSDLERLVVLLINKLDKKNINNDEINHILEERFAGNRKYGDQMNPVTIYQHHNALFTALIEKGYILSDNSLKYIFEYIERLENGYLKGKIDYMGTLEFVYFKLDKNTEIQKLNICAEFDEFNCNLDKLSYEDFIERLKDFCNKINSLKYFYQNNIIKRYCPEKYLQFTERSYCTTYKDLDNYILRLIMKYLALHGSNKLLEILEAAPNFDLNAYVKNYRSELKYWEYISAISNIIDFNEDGEPIYGEERFDAVGVYECGEYIEFTGNLMQYLILMNDVRAVDLLVQRGISLKFIYDNEDKTWDYVNSCTMKNYMESVLGNKEFKGLNDGEKDYLMNLLGENTPKRVLEKKEGSDN